MDIVELAGSDGDVRKNARQPEKLWCGLVAPRVNCQTRSIWIEGRSYTREPMMRGMRRSPPRCAGTSAGYQIDPQGLTPSGGLDRPPEETSKNASSMGGGGNPYSIFDATGAFSLVNSNKFHQRVPSVSSPKQAPTTSWDSSRRISEPKVA
jgi:hypothetical protein